MPPQKRQKKFDPPDVIRFVKSKGQKLVHRLKSYAVLKKWIEPKTWFFLLAGWFVFQIVQMGLKWIEWQLEKEFQSSAASVTYQTLQSANHLGFSNLKTLYKINDAFCLDDSSRRDYFISKMLLKNLKRNHLGEIKLELDVNCERAKIIGIFAKNRSGSSKSVHYSHNLPPLKWNLNNLILPLHLRTKTVDSSNNQMYGSNLQVYASFLPDRGFGKIAADSPQGSPVRIQQLARREPMSYYLSFGVPSETTEYFSNDISLLEECLDHPSQFETLNDTKELSKDATQATKLYDFSFLKGKAFLTVYSGIEPNSGMDVYVGDHPKCTT